MDSAIVVNNVSKTFYDLNGAGHRALDKVNLTVKAHELVLIVGPNGSGKTTLFNVISGAVQPDDGRVLIANQDVTNRPQHKRARFLWQVLQDPTDGVCNGLTVREMLQVAVTRGSSDLWDRWFSRKDGQSDFNSLLKEVKLNVPLDRQVTALSGGEKQLLGLVISMMVPTPVLLLDEPAANLDPDNRETLESAIEEFVDHNESAVLWICHDPPLILDRVDKIFWMMHGNLIEKTKEQVVPWLKNSGFEENGQN